MVTRNVFKLAILNKLIRTREIEVDKGIYMKENSNFERKLMGEKGNISIEECKIGPDNWIQNWMNVLFQKQSLVHSK